MRALLASIGGWLPERQLVVRARGEVSYVTISRRLQFTALVSTVAILGWSTYATIYYATFDWILQSKNQQIAESRIAYRNAMQQIGDYNERLMAITRNLEQSQFELLARLDPHRGGAAADGAPKRQGMGESGLARAAASHRAMTRQIEGLEEEWRELAARNATLEHGLASIGNEVESILAERGEVIHERDELRDQVGSLEANLADLRVTQDVLVERLIARTETTVGGVESVIAMTGLDVEELIARVDEAAGGMGGQGGPFIAASAAEDDPLEQKIMGLDVRLSRWQQLRQVLNYLPLIAPVDHYRLASGFGKRRDPMTNKWSQHNGIDMSYHLNTPILAPAPGKVVFTGWRGGLGRVVEIDHGMGLRTRYAHLKKILVKRGQEVEFREKIALMGSSGRSTGVHVHYEILVDGKPHDPLKFIKAGKYAFKS